MSTRFIWVAFCFFGAIGVIVFPGAASSDPDSQIRQLYQMYSRGSGWDDGAVGIILNDRARYAPQIKSMIDQAAPGTMEEEIALTFFELVIDIPDVRDSLKKYGENHPDPDTARLISQMLKGPMPRLRVLEGDGIAVDLILPEDDDP